MPREEILMIGLGRIKGAIRLDGGDDLRAVNMRGIELRDIGLGDARLLVAGREDRRAILRADIGTLLVELGRIMGDRKIYLQNLAVANAPRIKGDLHRFGMAGLAGADGLVFRRRFIAAGIARNRADDAGDMLEDALHAPEAAAGEH